MFLRHIRCPLLCSHTYLAQMPRHPPQPLEQFNPALLQEKRRVSHPILQLHRTTFSSAF